jgi:CRP-like cAMP-binding protein
MLDLLDHLDEVALADGGVAVQQGDEADAMFLIQDGRLSIWIGEPGPEGGDPGRRVRTLHAG